MENKDMPAMPLIDEHSTHEVEVYAGLTKREHFIAMAMQGLCSSVELTTTNTADISRNAVIIADQTMKIMEAAE